MIGRFNQDLLENLQTAFKKATNFEPRIITKQSINNRKIHEVNHIDITHGEDEVEINEAHVRNPNYKGKNYDPNYQQNRTKRLTTRPLTLHQVTITIATKAMDHQVTTTIATKATDHQVTITIATKATDTTKPTNRRNRLMYLSHYMDRSARNSYIRSRRYYDIHHSTETGSNQKTTQ